MMFGMAPRSAKLLFRQAREGPGANNRGRRRFPSAAKQSCEPRQPLACAWQERTGHDEERIQAFFGRRSRDRGRSQAIKAARLKRPNHRSRPWSTAGAPAVISHCSLSRRRIASGSGPGLSQATSTTRMTAASDRAMRGRPMAGRRSMCRERAGSPSIRRTAASAAST